jgi:hypothetical protein
VIIVVALMISLAVPAIMSVRRSAWSTKSQVNLQQIFVAMQEYCNNNSGVFPRVDESVMYPIDDSGNAISYPFWQVDETWVVVLKRELPRWLNREIIYSPRSQGLDSSIPRGRLTSYQYSWSFVSRPELWHPHSPVSNAVYNPVRDFDVRYPSSKAFMWDREMRWTGRPVIYDGRFDINQPTPILFADASVRTRIPRQASEPVQNITAIGRNDMRLRNTAHGVYGTDY